MRVRKLFFERVRQIYKDLEFETDSLIQTSVIDSDMNSFAKDLGEFVKLKRTEIETLKKEDLYKLEEYSIERKKFKSEVLATKKHRSILVGNHINLLFENSLTIKYQIQEMLRIEKIFEAELIQDELDTYNPLIPDGNNLKATMLIEYTDILERKEKLQIKNNTSNRIAGE